MTIRVTQKHIDEGEKGKCKRCPVALAMCEATGLNWGILPAIAWIGKLELRFPARVRKFIDQFDNGKPVKPFTFKITLQND